MRFIDVPIMVALNEDIKNHENFGSEVPLESAKAKINVDRISYYYEDTVTKVCVIVMDIGEVEIGITFEEFSKLLGEV